VFLGSAAIVYHLFTVVTGALTAPSGPWVSMEGPTMRMPPQALVSIHDTAALPYLTPIKMTHNYHFASNRTAVQEAELEFILLDESGKEIKTVRLPEKNASGATRYWQALLARWSTDDQPLPPPPTPKLAAPGENLPEVTFWSPMPGAMNKLEKVTTNINDRRYREGGGMLLQPSALSMLMLRSYARHLARVHGAADVEAVRLHRNVVPQRLPGGQEAFILSEREIPEDLFGEVASYYRSVLK
jgi:hypothetical protein